MKSQILELYRLANMMSEIERFRLGTARARQQSAEASRRDLQGMRSQAISRAAPDAAHTVGADRAFLRWATLALARNSVELAEAAAHAESRAEAARRAFGRAGALADLADARRGNG